MLLPATARDIDQLHTIITHMYLFVRAHVAQQPLHLSSQLEATVVARLGPVRGAMGAALSRKVGRICTKASKRR